MNNLARYYTMLAVLAGALVVALFIAAYFLVGILAGVFRLLAAGS